MSTRSVIAIPEGDGFKGKYVHFDGYPEGMLPELLELVREHGVEKVREVLVFNSAGFSSVNRHQSSTLEGYYTDGRFLAIPGWGVAYNPDSEQGSLDDWITPFHKDPEERSSWMTEWGYVLGSSKIFVFVMNTPPKLVEAVDYNTEPDEIDYSIFESW